jgi:twitching motility protein PilT
MNGKEHLATFKAAAWKNAEDVERFVASVSELTAVDAQRLLDVIAAKPPAAEAEKHRLRCDVFVRLADKVPDKTLFPAYVRALRNADSVARAALAQLLPRVNNVSEHAAFTGLLRSPDGQLRQLVAKTLPAIGGKTAFELIEEMTSEPAFPGRSEAMDAVLAMAPQHAIPVLQNVVHAGSVTEKVKALQHLTEPRCTARDPAAALKAVTEALADASESVVAAAIAGVSALASEDDYFAHVVPLLESRSPAVVRAGVSGLRAYGSPRSVKVLARKLRSGPHVVRLAVLDALEAIGTSDVLPPLVEALGHTQLAVRARASEVLKALSLQGKLDLARTVIWLLRSRDVNVRRMAVELVQAVKDPDEELWPKLLGFLRDDDWWVRERVMDALADMAGPKLAPHLGAFLQDPSDLVRRFGVDALLRLRAPESLGALVHTAQSDPDWWVRERAIEAIALIKDARAVPHVVDVMLRNQPLQVACLHALTQLQAHGAAGQVQALLASEDGDVQLAALECLKAIGGPAQGGAVQPLLRDPRPELRTLARELIARWGAVQGESVTIQEGVPILDQLLIAVAKHDGDDLILGPGRRPLMKKLGRAQPLSQSVLAAERVKSLLVPHLTSRQLEDLEARREVDFSYRVETEALRFRVNVFQQLGGLAAVFRIIKGTLPQLESLGLPAVAAKLADLNSGLVLVGGATGSGKSTTLAALIDYINRTSKRHIITLEDPIEVVHPRKQSLINQREVGTHTGTFGQALRATLREDPDVILVGEMRDLPTISFAVTAAETGHLVFGTIHTVSASGSIDRLINAFPPGQQDHVRAMLAGSLRAVLCQYLLPRADAAGRVLAVEVMLNNEAIANLIRKGKTFQIPSLIQTSRELGMQLMDQELLRLLREGKLSRDEAYAKAASKKEFEAAPAPAAPPPR